MEKLKVLIVDDDKDALTIYSLFAKQRGFDVITASDSDSAKQKLREKPDFFVTDIHLVTGVYSSKEGYGLARAAVANGVKHVVIYTSSGTPSQSIDGVEIIDKPDLPDWLDRHL